MPGPLERRNACEASIVIRRVDELAVCGMWE